MILVAGTGPMCAPPAAGAFGPAWTVSSLSPPSWDGCTVSRGVLALTLAQDSVFKLALHLRECRTW